MYNLGDDHELDRMSREAAGNYDSPGKPDWQVMEALLDKEMPVQEKKRRFLIFWWLLPIAITGASLFFWNKSNHADDQTITEKTIEKNSTQPNPALVNKELSSPKTSGSIAEKNIESSQVKDEATAINPLPPTIAVAAKNKPAKKSGPQAVINESPSKNQPATEGKTVEIPAEAASTAKLQESSSPPVENKPTGKNTDQTTVTENQAAILTPTPAAVEEKPAEEKSSPVQKPSFVKKGRGWSYALLAGIDKSTVRFTYGNEPGYNIGALIGYHFNDHFSLHTGAIYTQKIYKLAGEDFTPPKGSWVSYYKLETVEGYCKMWEIPLQVKYSFNQHSKNSYFLSSGLSSYFMTNENYDYYYYYNGQLVMRNNAYKSTDTHLLSILHLSGGMEKAISRNLSLQVEPYAKIPLGGVGFGDIKLSSFGINFLVQHRQPGSK
ncbi:MAG: hypothetical protein RLZZ28_2549 [Bacteroidota bacterium]